MKPGPFSIASRSSNMTRKAGPVTYDEWSARIPTMNAVPALATMVPIEPGKPDPEITAEIIIEMIATVCARLWDIKTTGDSEVIRNRATALYEELHDCRLAFDPHDGAEVDAMLTKVSSIADNVKAGRLP